MAVTRARTAGAEIGKGPEGRVVQRCRCDCNHAGGGAELGAVRRRGCRWSLHAKEWNGHGERLARVRVSRDLPFERRETSRVVDHYDRRSACLLAEDRLRDARAGTAVDNRDGVWRQRTAKGGYAAAEHIGTRKYLDGVVGGPGQREAIGI